MYGSLQLAHAIAHTLVDLLQPVLVPICFVTAWLFVVVGLWGVVAAIRDSLQRAHRMHQIPCAQCRYFSGDYLLKCPVHPHAALSEAAINCRDFEPSEHQWQPAQSLGREA